MSRGRTRAVLTDCWYAVAAADDVGPDLQAVRVAGRPVVLGRTASGALLALEDRCAHRAYPLSAGRVEGETVVCGLCGFAYGVDGACVSVPTQPHVPRGARVPAFPTVERHRLVWLWVGTPGRSGLARVPDLPWLDDPGWVSAGGVLDVAAGVLLLLESFADVTQVPVVAPEISPVVLQAAPPPLEVEVSETTVRLSRRFAPAPVPGWQAHALGLAGSQMLPHDQQGLFASPAAWVDHWDVTLPDGGQARMRFTQLVTPVDAGRTRLLWRVSRDFAVLDESVSQQFASMFADYYRRVADALQVQQRVLDTDGPGPEVNVSADAAALKVRAIVRQLLTEQPS
jgi:vanillate O-demethylase monooxygenase subunit